MGKYLILPERNQETTGDMNKERDMWLVIFIFVMFCGFGGLMIIGAIQSLIEFGFDEFVDVAATILFGMFGAFVFALPFIILLGGILLND